MDTSEFMTEAVERYLSRNTAQHGDPELAEDEIRSALRVYKDLTAGMSDGQAYNLLGHLTAGVFV